LESTIYSFIILFLTMLQVDSNDTNCFPSSERSNVNNSSILSFPINNNPKLDSMMTNPKTTLQATNTSTLQIRYLPEELQIHIIQFCTPLERFKILCRVSKNFYHLIFSHRGWSCVLNTNTAPTQPKEPSGFSPHIKHISSCIFDCAWFLKKKKLKTLAVGGSISQNTSGVTASAPYMGKKRAILQARLPSSTSPTSIPNDLPSPTLTESPTIISESETSPPKSNDVTIENLFSKCNFEHIEVNCSTVESTFLLLSYAKHYCKYLKTLIFGYNYQVDIKDLIENILIPFSDQLEILKFNFQWDSTIVYNGSSTLPESVSVQVQPEHTQLLFTSTGVPFFGSPNRPGTSTIQTPLPTTVDIFKPSFELNKLKILDLYIDNTSPLAKQFFLKVCQSSPNLRVCKLRGMIQRAMLISLSKYCKYLEVLILHDSGKERLTDDAISDMLKLDGSFNSSLRVFSLLCPSLTLRSLALITKFCKNLEYFSIKSLDVRKTSHNDYIIFHKLENLKILKVKDGMSHSGWLSNQLLTCLPEEMELIKVPAPLGEEIFTLKTQNIAFRKLRELHLSQLTAEDIPNLFLDGCADNLKRLKLNVLSSSFDIIPLMKKFVPRMKFLKSLTLDLVEFDGTLFTVLSHLSNLRRLTIKTHGNIEKYSSEMGFILKRFTQLGELTIHCEAISQFFTENYIISLNNLVMMWLACPVNCKINIDHEELSFEDQQNISIENVLRCRAPTKYFYRKCFTVLRSIYL